MPQNSHPDSVNHSDEQIPDVAASHKTALDQVEPLLNETRLTHSKVSKSLTRSVKPDALSEIEIKEFLPSLNRWTTFGSWFIVALMGLGAVASTVVTYKTTVKTTATIRPTGEARLVQAGTEGAITGIVGNNYKPVKKGQVIAYIDNSRLHTQVEQLESNVTKIRGQLTRIKAQIKALEQQMNAELLQVQRAIDVAVSETIKAERTYRDRKIVTTAEVQEAQAQLNLAENEVQSYRLLVGDGAISQLKLAEKEAALQTAQARLKKLRAGLNPSDAEVVAARAKIAQEQSRKKATQAQFNQSREQLMQQQLEVQNQLNQNIKELNQIKKELDRSSIRASATGILYGLQLRNVGQVIRSGETIARIIPSNTPLEIRATVPSERINKVKVGQPTQMQVSACPVSVFGTLPGKVKSISPDTNPLNNSSDNQTVIPSTQITQPGYTIIVEPQQQFLQATQRTCELLPGAKGRLTIISRQETILSFLLRKIRLQTNF
ncbi:MAG: HlyD family efflux transporter periplasmic adaptor subunit [Cyanobacteria bacterium J06635_10]